MPQPHRLPFLLRDAVAAGWCGGAQVAVASGGRRLSAAAGSWWPGGPEVDGTTRFDVASVTKVVATTACFLRLVDRGFDLDRPASDFLSCAFPGRTVRQLLGHRAGLAPWAPWWEAARGHADCAGLWPGGQGGADRGLARRLTLDAAFSTLPQGPPDVGRVYSDLGFLALGEIAAQVGGAPLQELTAAEVWGPLGMAATAFHPLPINRSAVATGLLRPREPAPGQEGRYLVAPQLPAVAAGEVDDDNAWACRGVAGHAGVFSTASDLLAFGLALLAADEGDDAWVSRSTLRCFLQDGAWSPDRGLGFDRLARPRSSCGGRFGQGERGAVGHLGFTGASLWVDLDRRLVVALLTNRTFPSRTNLTIAQLRRTVHEAAVDWWQS